MKDRCYLSVYYAHFKQKGGRNCYVSSVYMYSIQILKANTLGPQTPLYKSIRKFDSGGSLHVHVCM